MVGFETTTTAFETSTAAFETSTSVLECLLRRDGNLTPVFETQTRVKFFNGGVYCKNLLRRDVHLPSQSIR